MRGAEWPSQAVRLPLGASELLLLAHHPSRRRGDLQNVRNAIRNRKVASPTRAVSPTGSVHPNVYMYSSVAAVQLAAAPDAAPFAATFRSGRYLLLFCRVKGRAGERPVR